MVQPSGGWAQLPLLLCVCLFNTPVKHRNSDSSGFKVPPFPFKTQSGIFSEPWTDTVLPQVQQGSIPTRLTLAGSCVLSPSNGTWASLPIPSSLVFWSLQKKPEVWEENSCQGCVLHVMVGMRWQKMTPNVSTSVFSRASSMFLE